MEELLKQVLGFYALHFGRFADAIAKELRTAFIKVCRVRGKSLGFILIAFEEIEFIFQHGEGRVQQKYREKLTKEDKSARQQGEEIAYRLREECMDAFGCYSPFSFLKIDEIKTLVKRYRNPYAHETIERLIEDDPTGKTAKDSITAALNFADDFISNGIVPRLVFLIGEGKDAFGRRFISCIGEEHLDNESDLTYSLNDAIHFYHSTLPFDPLKAYLMVERQDIGAYYEPSVYSYDDVVAFING